ncbi:hypothetical protein W02_22440 [Nitrospira sp. KM1]|uniref:hypothetical protein n=1 Tax=Nitrospira sp. KM1 TaxID=1936990 RepID=UPI0013A7666B|nr:hypothetical protein [Nitrospira sp. KM1]BCA55104.1 hypothetical protein W02_22440 [Nitrospira sp. KM1]
MLNFNQSLFHCPKMFRHQFHKVCDGVWLDRIGIKREAAGQVNGRVGHLNVSLYLAYVIRQSWQRMHFRQFSNFYLEFQGSASGHYCEGQD